MIIPRERDRAADRSRTRPEILIAEDNEATQWALRRLLESTGYSVVTVADGSALLYELEPVILEEPRAHPPDLIVTDVQMPGLDVFRVLEQLRTVGLETPIVVVTGYANDRIRHRAHQLGRALFLEKPVDIEQLEETVAKLTS